MVHRPQVDSELCFILMPFRAPFDGYYEHIIKPAVASAGMRSMRADEVFRVGIVLQDIWNLIWQARIIVADVTKRNPNVNYELGLCHALGVPTIIITQQINDVPFDYRHRRCIVYKTEEAKWEDKLKRDLASTITGTIEGRQDESDLRWPYDTSATAQTELRVFEIALSKLDQFIQSRASTPADRIVVIPPDQETRRAGRLEGMVAFLRGQALSDGDRGLLLTAEWQLSRSRVLADGEKDDLVSKAKSVIAQVFVRVVQSS